MTQAEMILADLQAGKRITPMDALRDYGCFRLGARIWDLKQAGHDIRMVLVMVGNDKSVAEYWLERKAQFPIEPTGQARMFA